MLGGGGEVLQCLERLGRPRTWPCCVSGAQLVPVVGDSRKEADELPTFGGRVAKSARGWGAGLQRYEIFEREPWMDDASSIDIPVSHQDQVFVQPPHSRVIGGNAFSPFGMLAYDDQPAISMQFHPEFEPAFAKALIESRFDRVPDPDAAIASLDAPDDRTRVAQWIRNFLES